MLVDIYIINDLHKNLDLTKPVIWQLPQLSRELKETVPKYKLTS